MTAIGVCLVRPRFSGSGVLFLYLLGPMPLNLFLLHLRERTLPGVWVV